MKPYSTHHTLINRLAFQARALGPTLERITYLAQRALNVPCVVLDIVDHHEVTVTHVAGEGEVAEMLRTTTRPHAYHVSVLQTSMLLQVDDIHVQYPLRDHPLTAFYAVPSYLAVPIMTDNGSLGVLVALDTSPRSWSDADRAILHDLTEIIFEAISARNQLVSTAQAEAVSQDALMSVSDQLVEGLLIVNSQGELLYANQLISAMSGYSPEALANPSAWQPLVRRADPRSDEEHDPGAGMIVMRHKVEYIRTDNSRWYAEVAAAPLYTNAGSVAGTIWLFHDTTEQQQTQLQLIKAQKLETVGQLAIGIAHDFNNLLTIVLGSAQLATIDAQPGTSLYSDLNEIYQATSRAARVTHQILSFARQQAIQLQIININELTITLAKLLRRAISNNIELVTLPDPDVALVYADPGQIEQILFNLALNARDQMPNGGKLVLETHNLIMDQTLVNLHPDLIEGLYVSVTVRDTRFSNNNLQQVSDHLSDETSLVRLHAIYHIVKQVKGMLMQEHASDEGMIFTLYIPRHEEASVEAESAVSLTNVPHGNETILLVEDDPSTRALIARFLHMCGYVVLEASNGDEAVRIVRTRTGASIDLVLTDMVMPHMNGNEVIQQIRSLRPGVKVIVTSGYYEAVAQVGSSERTAFMPKPFLLSDLAYNLRNELDT